MVRSEKKIVLAWTHRQATHFARVMMGWARNEWEFIGPGSEERLLGRYNITLYDVRAPRYQPTTLESEKMHRTRDRIATMLASERIVRLNVVNLP